LVIPAKAGIQSPTPTPCLSPLDPDLRRGDGGGMSNTLHHAEAAADGEQEQGDEREAED